MNTQGEYAFAHKRIGDANLSLLTDEARRRSGDKLIAPAPL
ncbi:hypothetical protein [Undibacterium umbellatum]|nr:hypothetical protein [Undibacterium umbellatum]